MDELDDEQHMPEGVESAVWQRLVQARRQKVESEQQVRFFFRACSSVVLNVVSCNLRHFLPNFHNSKSALIKISDTAVLCEIPENTSSSKCPVDS